MSQRKNHWEQVYRDKSALAVSWYQEVPSVSLSLIAHTGLGQDARIIDVGGGASVLVDHLLADGFTRLAVLDISGRALAVARERLGDKAAQVTWYEADVTRFEPDRRFALWHDRAVFHFLTEAQDRRRYVETLNRTLEPGGHLILAAFAIGGPTHCSGLEIVQYDSDKLLSALGEGFELVEQVDEAHVTPAGKHQAFSYFRLLKGI